MTFTGTALDLDRLADCCFGVTRRDALRPVAEALVMEIGGEPVWIAEADRAAYHAALAHGANHLVTLIAQAMQLLARGRGRRTPRRRPRAAARAPRWTTPSRAGDAALTGPVARGDAGTVAEHLASCAGSAPDIREDLPGAGPRHRPAGPASAGASGRRRRAAARHPRATRSD